jgi:hypothetical protein
MSIYKKLFEAKKEIGTITKNARNPFFKSNYLSLNGLIEAVEPILEKHNLLLLQPIKDGKVVTLIQDVGIESKTESSCFVSSEMQLPNIQDPQKLGSAITYYRRYTLQSLLGLLAQDDDGNTATKQVKEERKPAFKEGGWDYLMSDKATKEHIQQALNTNRMTPQEKKQLEALIK